MMIVRVYEEGEISWAGELEDLLDANHFLTGTQRERLSALEPGESVELDSDFRVERDEAANAPVTPRTGMFGRRVLVEERHRLAAKGIMLPAPPYDEASNNRSWSEGAQAACAKTLAELEERGVLTLKDDGTVVRAENGERVAQ